jgi:hypothetical protein
LWPKSNFWKNVTNREKSPKINEEKIGILRWRECVLTGTKFFDILKGQMLDCF